MVDKFGGREVILILAEGVIHHGVVELLEAQILVEGVIHHGVVELVEAQILILVK